MSYYSFSKYLITNQFLLSILWFISIWKIAKQSRFLYLYMHYSGQTLKQMLYTNWVIYCIEIYF